MEVEDEKLYDTDGCGEKGDPDAGDEDGSKEGEDAGGTADEARAEGKVAICANKNHKCLDPEGIGSMLRTKVNVNLGVSRDCKDYDIEMKKVMSAVELGAEAIMDLSSHGNTQPFRQKLTNECPVMIGTVPVYDSVIHYQKRPGQH